ncbi:MAG: AAA family ATPase [Bacteroidales bacterium]|nr:AAA family ATPase [Bacteroidales bacterium]MCF8387297.1 AAA family ATPase [Bacteroidales bacterium]MCF8396717.1 AAA family ATPase [Bacteroidales bacterium]
MPRKEVSERIISLLEYEPTAGQANAGMLLSEFLHEHEQTLLLLKGYAGTGKTSLVSALVRFLPEIRAKSVLLAPTGRAAKVLASYSGSRAYTIHKKIYRQFTTPDGRSALALQNNPAINTIYIVDEASMIPDNNIPEDFGFFSPRNILDDLIEYVYQGKNNRLILIGDTAQLPPVGLDISPALDLKYLKTAYSFKYYSIELTEVVRQKKESDILNNATLIRKKLSEDSLTLPLFLKPASDVSSINGTELEEHLHTAFSRKEGEGTVIITRSNKRANIFNQEIRNRILFREEEISTGDLLMVVKNNYFWLPKDSKAGFIANGDLAEIVRIRKIEEIHGFRFADISIRLIDYPEENDLDVKIIMDTILEEGASLSKTKKETLFQEILKDFDEIPEKQKKREKIKQNPYYNALEVKFAYALTCHKTQGGQWDHVFIDAPYLKDDQIDKEFIRWLYTAITRARQQLYLVNFKEEFFAG